MSDVAAILAFLIRMTVSHSIRCLSSSCSASSVWPHHVKFSHEFFALAAAALMPFNFSSNVLISSLASLTWAASGLIMSSAVFSSFLIPGISLSSFVISSAMGSDCVLYFLDWLECWGFDCADEAPCDPGLFADAF